MLENPKVTNRGEILLVFWQVENEFEKSLF